MKSRRVQETVHALPFVAAWFIVAWIGLVAWQVAEHKRTVHRHQEGLRRTGVAGIGMLEAAIRSMGRGRRERPDFLQIVLKEVVAVPVVRGAWLTEPDGTLLASTGAAQVIEAPRLVAKTIWLKDGVVVGRRIDTGACSFGRRRGPLSLESRPAHLFLFLDRTELDREIARDLHLRAGIGAAALVALTGAFLFVRGRLKTRRLRAELAIAEERTQHHRKWAMLGAGLAHETKNPLAVVRGIAQRLLEHSRGETEAAADAAHIVEEVDRVVARIEEFLQFSRPVEPRFESVDVKAILQDTAALIEADLTYREGHVRIHAEPLIIQADRTMLRQILLNLLVNAAQAIRPGGLITLSAHAGPEGTAILEITDDGTGLPADEIDKIFEPYYTRRPGGTGLGLAIVRRLVEVQGWHVTIASAPDQGTTVRITGITIR